MDYHWKVSFVLNGAKCKKDFTYYRWVVKQLSIKGGKPRIQFSLRFTKRHYQDYWRIFDLAEKKVSKILDTMAPGLFYNLGSPYFPVVADFEVVLENEKQLRAAGQQIPSHGSIRFTYKLLLSPAGFKTTLKQLSKIAKSPNKKILQHSLHLYRRSLSCEDEFDKFFTLWRSFNALYDHFSTGNYETRRILQILQKLGPNDVNYLVKTYSNVPSNSEIALVVARYKYDLFRYLVSRKLVDKRKNNRSHELKKAISTGQQTAILERAVLCLYVVRCNFAHGSDSQIVKDQRLFQVSSTFLAALLMCLQSKLI